MGQVDVQEDGDSVLSMFRTALLAHCENDRKNIAEMFLKFDSSKLSPLLLYYCSRLLNELPP